MFKLYEYYEKDTMFFFLLITLFFLTGYVTDVWRVDDEHTCMFGTKPLV